MENQKHRDLAIEHFQLKAEYFKLLQICERICSGEIAPNRMAFTSEGWTLNAEKEAKGAEEKS